MGDARPESMDDISAKLDLLLKNDSLHIFDAHEVLALQRMIELFRDAEGYIRVTKQVGLLIAFIVVAWTQWDRLVELVTGPKI